MICNPRTDRRWPTVTPAKIQDHFSKSKQNQNSVCDELHREAEPRMRLGKSQIYSANKTNKTQIEKNGDIRKSHQQHCIANLDIAQQRKIGEGMESETVWWHVRPTDDDNNGGDDDDDDG